MSTSLTERPERDVGVAYLLCALSLLTPIHGMHRFYTGRYISGAIWLLTGGLCWMGTLIDLFFIPKMIEDHNQGRKVW
ncbi:MAG: NINE protein [Rhodobacterales bacterium]|nr:NINE protein [Rhodobacterales bacterium]